MNVERNSPDINRPISEKRQAISRRSFLKATAAVTAANLMESVPLVRADNKAPSILVIGAGAFGGWTALHLVRRGANVVLVDEWGPGNSRASSGGETRVIRGVYGPNRIYVEWVARSFQLWRENELRWKKKLYHKTGAIWMMHDNDEYARASMPLLKEAGLSFEEWSTAEAAKRYSQINFDNVKWILHEEEAGFLLGRQSCQIVLDGFQEEGGTYLMSAAQPGKIKKSAMDYVILSDGAKFSADAYVFACGPWLGKLFPDVIGDHIRSTRQEAFFFGTPPGDRRFLEDKTPVWVDFGQKLFYGIPGNERRGMKIADDTRGPDFDPTSGERTPTPDGLKAAREFLEYRFPDLKGAPLLESRVCQYENTPDFHFLIDRHPEAENVWIVGGGSGHGFKMGPVVGEFVADLVLGKKPIEPFFGFARWNKQS
jgi:glycine/D-amino acid oxidase-like deaminating enzyme